METEPIDPTWIGQPDLPGGGGPIGWWDVIEGTWRWIVYPNPD